MMMSSGSSIHNGSGVVSNSDGAVGGSGTKRKFSQLGGAEVVWGELGSLLQQVLLEKRRGTATATLRTLLGKCSMLLVQLKECNRDVHVHLEDEKRAIETEKLAVDDQAVQLNNLLYQKNYFQREIKRCQNYRSKQQVEGLISEVDFSQHGPKELVEEKDDHQRMLNRLTFELQERKRLCSHVEELKGRKKALLEVNLQKKKFLDGLQSRLKTISKATVPVQQYISLNVSKQLEQHALADRLPGPLYILFYQLEVYRDTKDETMEVQIVGNPQDSAASSSDSSKGKQITAEKDQTSLSPHPLAVALHLSLSGKDHSKKCTIRFQFIESKEVIVVSADSGKDRDKLLVNLYPNDTGLFFPNGTQVPSSNQKTTSAKEFPGRPYKWAQWLGGLDYLQELQSPHSTTPRRVKYPIGAIIQQIKDRINNLEALDSQLNSLSKLSVPKAARSAFFPLQAITTIVSWAEISKLEFDRRETISKDEGAKAEEGELAPSSTSSGTDEAEWESFSSWYFKAVLQNGGAKLQAFIEISPEYPVRPPTFKLQLLISKEEALPFSEAVKKQADSEALKLACASSYDGNLKGIETEINANYAKLAPHGQGDGMLLSYQVQRLQICFDFLVQTKEYGEDAKQQGKTKVRPFRGRDRTIQF